MNPAPTDPTDPDGPDSALIEDVLCGQRREDDPEVRELLERHPELRARLDELRAITGLLDDAGDERRDLMARAARVDAAPGQDRVGDALRPLASGARTEAPASRSILGWLVAAAAALVLIPLWIDRDSSDPVDPASDSPEVFLGDPNELVRPVGAVERYGPLEWTGTAPLSGTFRVRVYAAGHGASFDPIDEAAGLTEPRWDPPETRTRDWPEHIRWEVEWLDANGAPVHFADALAERPPR